MGRRKLNSWGPPVAAGRSRSTLTILRELRLGQFDGAGIIVLGANNLTVGTNNLSTTFSGLIEGGGSLTKVGTGTFTLIGSGSVGTYSGGSTVSGGTLIVTNRLYSATGTGPVQVNAGTLSGKGKIAGPTTISTGSGAQELFLAPAAATTVQATLVIHSSLTLNADATYLCTFRARTAETRPRATWWLPTGSSSTAGRRLP